jgi:hypothetical protein
MLNCPHPEGTGLTCAPPDPADFDVFLAARGIRRLVRSRNFNGNYWLAVLSHLIPLFDLTFAVVHQVPSALSADSEKLDSLSPNAPDEDTDDHQRLFSCTRRDFRILRGLAQQARHSGQDVMSQAWEVAKSSGLRQNLLYKQRVCVPACQACEERSEAHPHCYVECFARKHHGDLDKRLRLLLRLVCQQVMKHQAVRPYP